MAETIIATVRIPASVVLIAVLSPLPGIYAQDPVQGFRDARSGHWGYRDANGRIRIAPRFIGAGPFRNGRAPVIDSSGFAIIDGTGRIVARIATDAVSAPVGPIAAPAARCAWTPKSTFITKGFECYVEQLRTASAPIGGRISVVPARGESHRSAVILKFPSGVVVHEDIRYEGAVKRILLPGVSEQQARAWQRQLYPDIPEDDGCSESWSSGAMPGGAFIEQRAGC